MKSHNNFISISKALAIIGIVVWHSSPPLKLGIFLMFFVVPLFFFTSGYFFKPICTSRQLIEFIKKKVLGLYLPYIGYSLPFLFLHNFFYKINIYNSDYGFHGTTSTLYSFKEILEKAFNIIFTMRGTEQLLGAFWFIRVLFIVSLTVGIFSFFSRKLLNINSLLLSGGG